MGLRAQDPVPDWISHVALIKDKQVLTGPKDEVLALEVAGASTNSESSELRKAPNHLRQKAIRKVIVELKNVSVSYHERKASAFVMHMQDKGDNI
jgi:hypothetical protein